MHFLDSIPPRIGALGRISGNGQGRFRRPISGLWLRRYRTSGCCNGICKRRSLVPSLLRYSPAELGRIHCRWSAKGGIDRGFRESASIIGWPWRRVSGPHVSPAADAVIGGTGVGICLEARERRGPSIRHLEISVPASGSRGHGGARRLLRRHVGGNGGDRCSGGNLLLLYDAPTELGTKRRGRRREGHKRIHRRHWTRRRRGGDNLRTLRLSRSPPLFVGA